MKTHLMTTLQKTSKRISLEMKSEVHYKKAAKIYRKSDQYINMIRKRKNLPALEKRTRSYKVKRESIIENLANEFNKHLNISSLLN